MFADLQHDARTDFRLVVRAYPVLVTAASFFLIVLLAWPRAARVYVAESIGLASPGGQAISAVEVERWLLSEEVLRSAAINLRSSHARQFAAIDGERHQDPVKALRACTRVLSLASPDESLRLAIVCEAGERRAALCVVEELGKQLADHFPAQQSQILEISRRERRRRAQEDLRSARAAEERQQMRLQGLRDAWLGSTALAAAPEAAPSPAPSVAVESIESWELRRSLSALLAERERLLELFLPAHPHVRALDAQISRLKEALDRHAPEGAIPERSSADQRQVLYEWRGSGAATAQNVPSDTMRKVLEGISQAQHELLEATYARQQAEAAYAAAVAETSLQAGATTWAVGPARIADILGDGQAHLRVALAALAAAAGGAVVLWLATLAQKDRPLLTGAQVQRTTSLPVLGTIAAASSQAAPARPLSPAAACSRWLTRASETVLLSFAVTVALSVVLDPGLAGDLWQEPLTTAGDLLWRIL